MNDFKRRKHPLIYGIDNLTQDEWLKIQNESDEFGYTFIEKPEKWLPKKIFNDGITIIRLIFI